MKIGHDSIPSSATPTLAAQEGHPGNPFVDLRVAITGGTSGRGRSKGEDYWAIDMNCKKLRVERSCYLELDKLFV